MRPHKPDPVGPRPERVTRSTTRPRATTLSRPNQPQGEGEMNSDQPADLENRNEKIFVLVHGAGQGAWAFGKVGWPLARDGHHVIARDLPGHGLRARFPQSYLERPSDPDRFATEPSPLAQLSAQDFTDEL